MVATLTVCSLAVSLVHSPERSQALSKFFLGYRMCTHPARGAEVLGEALARLDSGQGTGLAAIVGVRQNVDGVGARVDDNGLLGNGGAAQKSGGGGEDAQLHDGQMFNCGM